MKKVLPLVLLFAVLIYILPLAALFFPSGKNEESGSGTAPAPSASAPPVTDGTQAPSAPQPGTSAADDAEPPCSFWTKTPERWRRYPCGTLCAAQWRPKCP